MTRITRISFFTTLALLTALPSAGGILDTKHNLSAGGPGPVKSLTEEQVCIFCHTPHNARRDIPSLWNRSDSTVNYVPYSSSTLYAAVGQPTGASKLCLSCHDGTIALGALLTAPQETAFAGGFRFMPEGPAKIGSDLSDDHPVSLVYDGALAARNGELLDPAALPPPVRLDKNRELQCTACHNPHDDLYEKFLVMSNQSSGLCLACHAREGWLMGSHATSEKTWNGLGRDPWPRASFSTVAQNGCGSCHMPHTAGEHQRLLNYTLEEDTCLVCHNANVAATNIENELVKPHRHPVQNYAAVHDAAENVAAGGVQAHVECVDCHNPHQSNAAPSPGAPRASGALAGVSGIDAAGQAVKASPNLYEICFKCHGDANVLTTLPVTRQLAQLNTRLEFQPANPSFHPVEAQGVNANVPSLLPPYTTASIITCVDCHNNDSLAGPKGPHGSSHEHLLERAYTIADNTTESPLAYELCYKCHSRTSILGDQSFRLHNHHVAAQKAPCSACHDAHGISVTQGNAVNNSHLINFDLTIVQPDSLGRLAYENLGTATGRCFLTCHGVPHEPRTY